MRVKFLSGVGLGGGKFAEEGEVYAVADHFGRELVQDGRAMEYEGPEPEPESDPEDEPDPEPEPESDPEDEPDPEPEPAPDPEDEPAVPVQTRDPKPKRIR
jgi:outer membrane biosynthesis protein TonB